jgi:hypothetical protein
MSIYTYEYMLFNFVLLHSDKILTYTIIILRDLYVLTPKCV